MNDLKSISFHFINCRMNRIKNEIDEKDLGRTAIVFSPHPDDETLGCGGTIIKKKMAGAEVRIIFMANGAKSHPHLISENELKYIRVNEALAASRRLGLEKNYVTFLEYNDGELIRNQHSAIHEVIEILRSYQPDEIFIPHHKEPPLWNEDHFATNRIVKSALQIYKRKTIIYEYPIWLWYAWPWVSVPTSSLKQFLIALKQSPISGLSLLKDFRCSVYIGNVLELKLAALNEYKSQMTRLISDSRWQTLRDVSNGEFLDCFFQEYEIFHRENFHA